MSRRSGASKGSVGLAKLALRARCEATTDSAGYVGSPHENLVRGVRLDQFESDLRQGDGNELRMKFCAVHSSAALAVNCFAPFTERVGDVEILGYRGTGRPQFEKRLKIFPNRRPANLDVWIPHDRGAIAIESKLLEHLQPTKPEFAPEYDRLAPPISEGSWWAAYEEAKDGAEQFLDRAQLLKHYFGLRRLQRDPDPPKQLTLLYLFWEPLNRNEIDACRVHREQVEAFARTVAGSSISFQWMSYPELWNQWAQLPSLAEHAACLRARYEVDI